MYSARATSAAPTYFKPFRNPRTMEGYVDGAVFHNNPVRIANYESKLLWPDADQQAPDILLSIGTGQHGLESANLLDASFSDSRRLQIRKKLQQVKPVPREKRSMPMLKDIESWLTIFKKRVESALDAEATWKEFRKDVVGASSQAAAERYIRFNPRTKNRIPKMDEKSQVDTLQEDVIASLRAHTSQTKIKNIAQRLVASAFYFEKSCPSRPAEDNIIVQGRLGSRTGKVSLTLFKAAFSADSLQDPTIYEIWGIIYADTSCLTSSPSSAYKKLCAMTQPNS
jgi:hypothetical protein